MPLHLDAIMSNSDALTILALIIQGGLSNLESCIASEDKLYFHSTRFMRDAITNEIIGKTVYTHKIDKKNKIIETIDIDLTLYNEQSVKLRFLEKLESSSDANEYYNAEIPGTYQRLQIETVDRYSVTGSITGTDQEIYASAFPFSLQVYDDIDVYNVSKGLKSETMVCNSKWKHEGLANDFIAPSDLFLAQQDTSETFSFVVGVVKTIKNVVAKICDINIPFAIVQLETALGNLPVAIGREVFDIEGISPGKTIVMKADIKADFVQ